MGHMGIGIGLGILVLGAAYGIGKLAASAVESIARQPEVAGKISTTAIVLAALIEGFTFYGIITAGQVAGEATKAAASQAEIIKAGK
jgi:F-type H+-transporting ATPase subunit c